MLNQAVLVGRIVQEPELNKTDKGNITHITLAVPRSFKNMNGEYVTINYENIVKCLIL